MNLKVKIPKKFKQGILERFDYENRTDNAIFKICQLCSIYNSTRCTDCPFEKFTTAHCGCIKWIDKLLQNRAFKANASYIWWCKTDEKQAKADLAELLEKSKELIEWI